MSVHVYTHVYRVVLYVYVYIYFHRPQGLGLQLSQAEYISSRNGTRFTARSRSDNKSSRERTIHSNFLPALHAKDSREQ